MWTPATREKYTGIPRMGSGSDATVLEFGVFEKAEPSQ
jgi:hypothetical protein